MTMNPPPPRVLERFDHRGVIRSAAGADVEALRRVVSHRPKIARQVGGWIDSTWAYEIDGGVVGFATRHGARQLAWLYVHPLFRGAGIGSRLLAAMERLIRDEGQFGVSLHVEPRNRRARRLYERNGYFVAGRSTDGGWTMEKLFGEPPPLEDRLL
jgi:ribosomal protein S18 acetylase RimI-like enzyme